MIESSYRHESVDKIAIVYFDIGREGLFICKLLINCFLKGEETFKLMSHKKDNMISFVKTELFSKNLLNELKGKKYPNLQ